MNYSCWASTRMTAGVGRQKFDKMRTLCERCDLVMLQEVHGTEADLEQWRVEMPEHYFVGTFLDGAGGSVIVMRKGWMQNAIPLVTILDVGRIVAVQLWSRRRWR